MAAGEKVKLEIHLPAEEVQSTTDKKEKRVELRSIRLKRGALGGNSIGNVKSYMFYSDRQPRIREKNAW